MTNKEGISLKKKNICEKEIQEFFYFIEERLSSEPQKIEQFVTIIKEFNNQK